MKVESYAIKSTSEREYQKVESVSTFIARRAIVPAESVKEFEANAKLELSETAQKMIKFTPDQNSRSTRELERAFANATGRSIVPSNPTDLKTNLLEQLLFFLTGKRYSAQPVSINSNQQSFNMPLGASRAPAASFIETETFLYERESVTYQAQGVVHTADGKSISIDISLSMSREFAAYNYTSTQMPSKDPLVINYGGTAASLTGERFSFDLDADGTLDSISSLGQGSGFLALDKNGDGNINDGTELFGPQSGSGFDDLRAYDKDGNGWIDENDSVFDSLLVWSRDADGNSQLFSLKELDIGAIYLGDVATEFSLNGDGNESLGTVRSTSFFLKESGGAGTISHIDLTL